MQKILDTLYLHREEYFPPLSKRLTTSDRLLSRLFQELPDKKTYADYYVVIDKPIALDNIQVHLFLTAI